MNHAPASTRDMVLFERDGYRWELPVDRVHRIAKVEDPAALPFSGDGGEGIAFVDDRPVLQIDLSPPRREASGERTHALLVRTSKGAVLVRADRVGFGAGTGTGDGGGASDRPSALAAIEAVLAPLAAPPEERVFAPGHLAFMRRPATVALLVIEAAGIRIAFPASAVTRVERHRGVAPLRGGAPGETLVVLEGRMLAGLSLGVWLSGAVDGVEPWSLALDVGTHHLAVTASVIHGMVRAPASAFRTVVHRHGRSLYLEDSDHGAIEVIDPEALVGAAPTGEGGKPFFAPPPDTGSTDADAAALALGGRGGVIARVGAHACAFPASAALRVLREGDLERLAGRRAGASAVFDLADVLGVGSSGATCRRALLVRREGRRPMVLLADEIAPMPPGIVWHPLPIVPALARDLFSAVGRLGGKAGGREGGRCLFRVRTDIRGRAMTRIIAALGLGHRACWARPTAPAEAVSPRSHPPFSSAIRVDWRRT